MSRSLGLVVVWLGVGCAAAADQKPPATVLLIRHAEKPPDGDPSIHLAAAGKKRAEALPMLFEKSDGRPEPLPTPDFLFAAENSKSSHRSTETIAPLAKALNLPVDSSVENKDFAKVVKHVLKNPNFAGKTVLICWHHGTMPELARAFGASGVPDKLKDDTFDQVWRIDFGNGKATFRTIPMKLLPNDAAK